MTLIVPAHQHSRLGVDGDQLAIAPHAGRVLVGLAVTLHVVAIGAQSGNDVQRKALFHLQLVGQILMVKPRRIRRRLDIEPVIQHADQIVRNGRDNG